MPYWTQKISVKLSTFLSLGLQPTQRIWSNRRMFAKWPRNPFFYEYAIQTKRWTMNIPKDAQHLLLINTYLILPEWITLTWWGGLIHQWMETKNPQRPLTREPGRAVALGRVLVPTWPNFNDLFTRSIRIWSNYVFGPIPNQPSQHNWGDIFVEWEKELSGYEKEVFPATSCLEKDVRYLRLIVI
jgi:hypothetical protein